MKSRKQHSPILEAGKSFKQAKFFTTLQKFKVRKRNYRFKWSYLQSTEISKANFISQFENEPNIYEILTKKKNLWNIPRLSFRDSDDHTLKLLR